MEQTTGNVGKEVPVTRQTIAALIGFFMLAVIGCMHSKLDDGHLVPVVATVEEAETAS